MAEPRPGDYNYPVDFPEQPRCLAPTAWIATAGCCREEGHGGPHHYELDRPLR